MQLSFLEGLSGLEQPMARHATLACSKEGSAPAKAADQCRLLKQGLRCYCCSFIQQPQPLLAGCGIVVGC